MTDVAAARTEVRPRALVSAVPAWAWLTGIVVVSTAIRFLLARRIIAPTVMVDELIYSELAKNFAEHGRFLIRDTSATWSFGVVYPALISPAYRLFSSVPDAYQAAKAINAVLMSLAAIPAYFLARRVLGKPLALLGALLSVTVPSLLYTGFLMTENAFYPLFLCVALALVRMLESPTRRNQLGLVALCLFAYETRHQALALFPAVLTAPLLLGRAGVGRFRVLYAAVAGAVAVAVLAEVARGRTPLALLGAYEKVGRHEYSLLAVLKWLVWHAAELDLYLGVIPFAASLALALSWRSLEPTQRTFVAATAALSAWLIVEVAAFASLPGVTRVEERNMFYVAPFFLIALLVWIDRSAQRTRSTVLAGFGAAMLVGLLLFSNQIHQTPTVDTLLLTPWWRLHAHGLSVHEAWLVATFVALCAGALFAFVPRRFALALPLLVFVYFGVSQRPIENLLTRASRDSLFVGIRSVPPDWIDRRVGKSADVAAIWSGRTNPYVIWENEYFNRSVGPVYHVGRPVTSGIATPGVQIDPDGYLRDANGKTIHHRYAFSDGSVELDGTKRAVDASLGITLWELDGPIRALTEVAGLYPGGTWSGSTVAYHRRLCTGGSVRVALSSDSSLFRSQTVRSGGVARHVFPFVVTVMTVPLTDCRARFVVSPTKVPGDGDFRRLGVHFLIFEYLPPR